MEGAKLEHQSFGLKIKSVDETGRFSGLGAVFGNIDQGGDRIVKGAFTRTLQASKTLPLLWQHKSDEPIGSVQCSETTQGLQVEGQLLLSDPTAQKAYQFLKAGVIKGLSIGFEAKRADFVGDVRELQEIKLYELSVVTFPMNESATVTSVKAMSDEDRAKHFKAIDTHRKAIDRHQRGIRESLKALYDNLEDDNDETLLNPSDDPAMLEGESGEMGMLVSELKALAAQAEELASA
jgi:uncharacterized protein